MFQMLRRPKPADLMKSRVLVITLADLQAMLPSTNGGLADDLTRFLSAKKNTTGQIRRSVRYGSFLLKRPIDIIIASCLLCIALPALVVISLVLLPGHGTVLFCHSRIGRYGHPFNCLKFRTMYSDAEDRLQALLAADPIARQEWQDNRKLKSDPRVTPVGRVLRATSLDELPQLINVLLGDMSLVGPRPVVSAELSQYYKPLGGLRSYLSVRPGITGLWQVSGRSSLSYAARVRLDVQYVRSQSTAGDIAILFRTVSAVMSRTGAI